MTPTQLRAYVALVRLGSFKLAAEELRVSESAISFNVAQLRKELGDPLVTRRASGLAFTPGGLRLASRAAELLGLQDRTRAEVSQAASGRRLLRIAASSLFGEYAAPGLIELFASRAADLDVELSLHRPTAFAELLSGRSADVAIGPRPAQLPETLEAHTLMHYRLVLVVAPSHPLAGRRVSAAAVRAHDWFLGPSAVSGLGVAPDLLRAVGVPEERQRIFQSHAAATEEAKRGMGITPAMAFAVGKELSAGTLARVEVPDLVLEASWHLLRMSRAGPPEPHDPADELVRFAATPRAIQAMVRGTGVTSGRFRPAVHVTLWT
ncbi:MAG: LysR family transcriptional regulator [Dermatophilaceae bacterium]